MKVTDKYVFFYGEWPSNFQRCEIKWTNPVDGKTHIFKTTEQGFMYRKAFLFGDMEIADRILKTDNPSFCKQLGRKVKGYDNDVWDAVRYMYFHELNYLKYTQNEFLKKKLLNNEYDGKIFVEASPHDRIWGIGFREDDPMISDESKWGQNLLGKVITDVRRIIIEEEKNGGQ